MRLVHSVTTNQSKQPVILADTAIIILAAGNSSRLGQSKQLLEIDGTPLLRHTILEALKSNAAKVIVVLGSEFDRHQIAIREFNKVIEIVDNEDWKRGMGGSIKKGIQQIIDNESISSAIVCACDQPYLSSDIFNSLIETCKFGTSKLIASKYDAFSFGVPVLFTREMFDKILTIEDFQGTKKLVVTYKRDAEFISFELGKVDIDTEEDYLALMAS